MDKIRQERVQSYLLEIIQDALSNVYKDVELKDTAITRIECPKSKYVIKAYIYTPFLDKPQKNILIKKLNKARHIAEEYVFEITGWFKSPSITFFYDDKEDNRQHIEKLFDKIKKKEK